MHLLSPHLSTPVLSGLGPPECCVWTTPLSKQSVTCGDFCAHRRQRRGLDSDSRACLLPLVEPRSTCTGPGSQPHILLMPFQTVASRTPCPLQGHPTIWPSSQTIPSPVVYTTFFFGEPHSAFCHPTSAPPRTPTRRPPSSPSAISVPSRSQLRHHP